MNTLTYIDLFCGCGGFSLGMRRAGFKCLAAIDFYSPATNTFKANLSDETLVLCEDLTKFTPEKLAARINSREVDVVVGGPPCQGFSTARRCDGANHGKYRLIDDKRRRLYRQFLSYVGFFRPRIFVMENVLGIRSAADGKYFTAVQTEARRLGYRVHGQIEDAWKLGVPQRRRRQLFIGVRNDLPGYFLPELKPARRAEPYIALGPAIYDLPILRAAGGEDEREYDFVRRMRHVDHYGAPAMRYLRRVLEIDRAEKLTNHVARPHSDRDLRDFLRLREGESSAFAMRVRKVNFEFPYDKTTFKDRYTRQSRSRACSTIVAHLSKDGLMFIHPTQNRSLTPREAARVQSFPDWFRFPESRTQSFRLIGNAVPPLVSEAVGAAIKTFLTVPESKRMPKSESAPNRIGAIQSNLPKTRSDAALALQELAKLDRRSLRALPKDDFLRGWRALLFLFPDLHPDSALDHGSEVEESPSNHFFRSLSPSMTRRYARSGWPVALALIGLEAWWRHDAKQLTKHELYCVEAQHAGLLAGKEQ
jgi:DNA (cytosine-5)-methyltransferase 1